MYPFCISSIPPVPYCPTLPIPGPRPLLYYLYISYYVFRGEGGTARPDQAAPSACPCPVAVRRRQRAVEGRRAPSPPDPTRGEGTGDRGALAQGTVPVEGVPQLLSTPCTPPLPLVLGPPWGDSLPYLCLPLPGVPFRGIPISIFINISISITGSPLEGMGRVVYLFVPYRGPL